jgi:hypothetical protein
VKTATWSEETPGVPSGASGHRDEPPRKAPCYEAGALKIVAVKKPVVEKRVIKNCRYLQLQGSHSLRGEEAYK